MRTGRPTRPGWPASTASPNGTEDIDEAKVGDHTKCALGTWYFGPGRGQSGAYPQFKAIERPHASMHAAVKAAVKAKHGGNQAQLMKSADEVRRYSDTVVRTIDALEAAVSGPNGGDVIQRRRADDWSKVA